MGTTLEVEEERECTFEEYARSMAGKVAHHHVAPDAIPAFKAFLRTLPSAPFSFVFRQQFSLEKKLVKQKIAMFIIIGHPKWLPDI